MVGFHRTPFLRLEADLYRFFFRSVQSDMKKLQVQLSQRTTSWDPERGSKRRRRREKRLTEPERTNGKTTDHRWEEEEGNVCRFGSSYGSWRRSCNSLHIGLPPKLLHLDNPKSLLPLLITVKMGEQEGETPEHPWSTEEKQSQSVKTAQTHPKTEICEAAAKRRPYEDFLLIQIKTRSWFWFCHITFSYC